VNRETVLACHISTCVLRPRNGALRALITARASLPTTKTGKWHACVYRNDYYGPLTVAVLSSAGDVSSGATLQEKRRLSKFTAVYTGLFSTKSAVLSNFCRKV